MIKMTFELYTKKLFFNASIEKFDKSLLAFFKKEKKLSEVVYEGHTVYPPLSALRQEKSQWHTFQFKSHPQIDFKFREGSIELRIHKRNRKEFYFPVLRFIFNRKEEALTAFHSLVKEFENKVIKNKNDGRTAEFIGNEYQVNLSYGKGDVLINGYVLLLFLTRYLD